MSELDCLRAQTRHHYAFLSRAVRDVDGDQARVSLRAGGPSVAWELGHCTLVSDSVAEAVGGAPRLLQAAFEGRHELPHWGVVGADGWEQLRADWARVAEHTLAHLDALGAQDLALPPACAVHGAFQDSLRTRADFLRGHVFHVAYHLGQIGSLRAGLGLGW